MEFIPSEIALYAEEHSSAENEILKKINRYTQSHVLMPRMISGHIQGRTLAMFSQMINPKYILEIGTYTGYSALCLAEGLVGDGKLITIDNNEELEDLVKEHVSMSPKASQIEVRTGNALDIIETYNYAWDMVFIDADKENYLNYYKQIIDKIKPGGFILADNVLWSGKVVDPKSLSKDIDTQKIHEFNEYIANDSRVEHVLLPIRDGIMVVRKK